MAKIIVLIKQLNKSTNTAKGKYKVLKKVRPKNIMFIKVKIKKLKGQANIYK